MQSRALILEAYHTTHIEGTHLTLPQSKEIWKGQKIKGVDPDDVKELLNYNANLNNYFRTGNDIHQFRKLYGYNSVNHI